MGDDGHTAQLWSDFFTSCDCHASSDKDLNHVAETLLDESFSSPPSASYLSLLGDMGVPVETVIDRLSRNRQQKLINRNLIDENRGAPRSNSISSLKYSTSSHANIRLQFRPADLTVFFNLIFEEIVKQPLLSLNLQSPCRFKGSDEFIYERIDDNITVIIGSDLLKSSAFIMIACKQYSDYIYGFKVQICAVTEYRIISFMRCILASAVRSGVDILLNQNDERNQRNERDHGDQRNERHQGDQRDRRIQYYSHVEDLTNNIASRDEDEAADIFPNSYPTSQIPLKVLLSVCNMKNLSSFVDAAYSRILTVLSYDPTILPCNDREGDADTAKIRLSNYLSKLAVQRLQLLISAGTHWVPCILSHLSVAISPVDRSATADQCVCGVAESKISMSENFLEKCFFILLFVHNCECESSVEGSQRASQLMEQQWYIYKITAKRILGQLKAVVRSDDIGSLLTLWRDMNGAERGSDGRLKCLVLKIIVSVIHTKFLSGMYEKSREVDEEGEEREEKVEGDKIIERNLNITAAATSTRTTDTATTTIRQVAATTKIRAAAATSQAAAAADKKSILMNFVLIEGFFTVCCEGLKGGVRGDVAGILEAVVTLFDIACQLDIIEKYEKYDKNEKNGENGENGILRENPAGDSSFSSFSASSASTSRNMVDQSTDRISADMYSNKYDDTAPIMSHEYLQLEENNFISNVSRARTKCAACANAYTNKSTNRGMDTNMDVSANVILDKIIKATDISMIASIDASSDNKDIPSTGMIMAVNDASDAEGGGVVCCNIEERCMNIEITQGERIISLEIMDVQIMDGSDAPGRMDTDGMDGNNGNGNNGNNNNNDGNQNNNNDDGNSNSDDDNDNKHNDCNDDNTNKISPTLTTPNTNHTDSTNNHDLNLTLIPIRPTQPNSSNNPHISFKHNGTEENSQDSSCSLLGYLRNSADSSRSPLGLFLRQINHTDYISDPVNSVSNPQSANSSTNANITNSKDSEDIVRMVVTARKRIYNILNMRR